MVKNYGLSDIKKPEGNVILKEVNISGNICGEFLEISIEQAYQNISDCDIEAQYIFPIPDTAFITGFEALIGGKVFKAKVEDKNIAKKIYDERIKMGGKIFELEEIDDNIFKITIGKILRSETIKIKVSYIDQLVYANRNLVLVIPTASNPLYMSSDDGKLSEIVEHKLKLNLLIEPLSKTKVYSSSHEIIVEWDENNLGRINLKNNKELLDRDLVLTFKEENALEANGMIYQYGNIKDKKGILYLRFIPELEDYEENEHKNYDFLIDISESMEGEKLDQAKNALQMCIRNLSEGDTFNIVAAENKLHYFSENGKVSFNDSTLKNATKWIDNLKVLDDAEIFDALKYCLSEKNNDGISTILVFTDDEGEKDDEIIEYVKNNIFDNRLFTFGIDTSASNYFINKLAEVGYGKAEFIYPGERIEDMVLRQIQRIESPQLDVTEIRWGSMTVERTYPRTIDYFYNDEPFSIFAKVTGEIEGNITICGKVGTHNYQRTINLDSIVLEPNADLIERVWIKKRIDSIEEKSKGEKGDIACAMRKKVVELSKKFEIISNETSFIMLESTEDPVLGVSLNNIVPVKVSDEVIKNITESYFIESPNFIYKTINSKNSKIDRENILRMLARNQFADGSFADAEEYDLNSRVETTAMALLVFACGKEDMGLYGNQISKSVKFILKTLSENSSLNPKSKVKALLSLRAIVENGSVKGNLKEQIEERISIIDIASYFIFDDEGCNDTTVEDNNSILRIVKMYLSGRN